LSNNDTNKIEQKLSSIARDQSPQKKYCSSMMSSTLCDPLKQEMV
jgi:hypothetical protein